MCSIRAGRRGRLLAVIPAVLAAGILGGCIPLVTVVQHKAVVTVQGLPASGTIAQGQGLPGLTVNAQFEPLPSSYSPRFGEVRSVSVTFRYTSDSGDRRSAGPYEGGAWSRFTVPDDAKVGTDLEIVTIVESAIAKSDVVFLDGKERSSYATYSETTKLRITARGGGGGSGDSCPAPQTTQPAPTAVLISLASPMSVNDQSSVDARLSTDPLGRELRYSWDVNGDCKFGDASGDEFSGIASVPPGPRPSIVRVRVSTSGGAAIAQQSVPITWADLSINASITRYGPTQPNQSTEFSAFRGDSSRIANGCFDGNGDGVHDRLVPFADSTEAVTINAAATVGTHVVSMTLWAAGTNPSCAKTGTSGDGLVQVVKRTYTVVSATSGSSQPVAGASFSRTAAGTPAIARQGAAKRYVATSSLRLNPKASPVPGAAGADGVARGVVTTGTFTFSTPAKAGKTARPSGLADLRSGTYVARAATSTISGSGSPGQGVYTGTSTVLLRGRSGTLACVTANASIASSVLTMLGGTGPASRLVFVANHVQTPFSLPTIADYVRQTQSKTPPKARPVIGKGPITASTGTKARALNATCKGLLRYLR